MYGKKTISQIKFSKLSSNDLENYVNIETGEVLDLLIDKKEASKTYIKLTYNFSMINKDIDNKKLLGIIGATYYGYLLLLINYIKTDNRVRFEILPFPKPKDKKENPGLVKFKGVMKKRGIIKRCKLDNMKKGDYFLNPLFSSYGRDVSLELIEEFRKENKTIYGVTIK